MAKTKPKSKSKTKAKTKAKTKTKKNARPSQTLPPALQKRLAALAKLMNTSMAALTVQALSEFADTWEDHFRNVKALQDDDRIQLAVKPE
jgi:predicted transcriptional regulator